MTQNTVHASRNREVLGQSRIGLVNELIKFIVMRLALKVDRDGSSPARSGTAERLKSMIDPRPQHQSPKDH